MYIANISLNINPDYHLEHIAPLEELLCFDIETTGFSAKQSFLYLIGALYFRDGCWQMTQWLAESPEDEPALLEAFFSFCKSYRCLLHFNGDTFDLPYLKKKADLLSVTTDFPMIDSFDLYRQCRPLKKLLKLEHMNLKSLEQFISLDRIDSMSGGELIPIYQKFQSNGSHSLRKLLLRHNQDDLIGTLRLTPLLAYLDVGRGRFEINHIDADQNDDSFSLTINLTLPDRVPKPVSINLPDGYLILSKNSCRILLHGFTGTLKHFFPDYKNYYYLPAEDEAIHKSVASYVSSEHRRQAKAATCYCRKSGLFLPAFGSHNQPVFYRNYNEGPAFIEYTQTFLDNPEALRSYLTDYFCAALSINCEFFYKRKNRSD